MKILNVCAGDKPVTGAINTDIIKIHPDYIIWDINKKSPFKGDSFDIIILDYAINFVQPINFIKFMEEIYRIGKNHCHIFVKAYSTRHMGSLALSPFRLHPNDIKNIFTKDGWYFKHCKTKTEFLIHHESHNKILKRWATQLLYILEVKK